MSDYEVIGCSQCPYSKPNSDNECFYANTSVAKDCMAYIDKPNEGANYLFVRKERTWEL